MENPAEEIIKIMRERRITLGAVESATGGLISHLITNAPGASFVYLGGINSYSNEIKSRVVGVKEGTIRKHGAVSAPVAEEMALGGRKLLGVDVCIADTGIAGPGGATRDKPMGLFYIGLANATGTYSRKHVFSGTREENKMSAALAALEWVREYLRV